MVTNNLDKKLITSPPRGGRPRILQIFSQYREYGGEEGSVYRIGDALHRDFEVSFFKTSSADAFSGGILHKGISTLKAYYNWSIVKQLKCYQEAGHYEYWLIHNVFPAMSPAVYELAFKLGIPVVHYLHNYRLGCVNGFFLNHGKACQRCMHGNFLPALQTACWHESHVQSGIMGAITSRARGMDLFQRTDHWIAISEAQKAEHVLMGIPEERITVIPHFLESAEELPPYPKEGDALYVGRLSSEKGVDRLLLAWEKIQHCGRTLWIVGDGPERAALEEIVRNRKLQNVCFTGFLEHQQMAQIWRNVACTIIPSVWKEPFGMVVLEAWAKGRPVVAHRIGALPEIITHDYDGLLTSSDSTEQLSAALLKILLNPGLGEAMGKAGWEKLKTRYSKDCWMESIRPIFSSRPKS